jgi:hypothetical protein
MSLTKVDISSRNFRLLKIANLFYLCKAMKKSKFIGHAGIAQLVEQLICNQQVAGSSPIASSKFLRLCINRYSPMGRCPSG